MRFFSTIVIMALAAPLLISCDDQYPFITGEEGEIEGSWVEPKFDETNSTYTYRRASELIENTPGINFINNGSLVERKNSGDCATPPIHYSDFDGTWGFTSDTILLMEVGYWGGVMAVAWDIEEIGSTELVIKIISSQHIGD